MLYNQTVDHKEMTINTYNASANELAKYFKGIGPRVDDIDRGLLLAESPVKARVVEIGCGDGRDAAEIIKKVSWYEGFDPSKGLLGIARRTLPNANFVLADAVTYNYPKNLDVVYAFASLLHVNRNDFIVVCNKVGSSLRKGGIFYISLKERKNYTEEIKKDVYGERMFYHYSPGLVKRLAGKSFTVVHEEHQKISSTDWFTLALKRI